MNQAVCQGLSKSLSRTLSETHPQMAWYAHCTPSTRDRPFCLQRSFLGAAPIQKMWSLPLFLRLTAPEPALQWTRDNWGAGAYRPHHKTLQERTVHKGTAWEFCETKVLKGKSYHWKNLVSFEWKISPWLFCLSPWTARPAQTRREQNPRLGGLWDK